MNNDNNRLNLPVFLTLQDGRELTVDLIVNLGGAIDRTMNNDARFVLIGDADGSERLIAKSIITEIRDAKKSRQASNASPVAATATTAATAATAVAAPGIVPEIFDPHQALGVSPMAGADEIRNAFVEQAQAYNPDRLAHIDLPADVTEFCANRYQQISKAYATLTEGQTPVLADPALMAS
ncbi:MAG: DnaJ domain-containing protein [Rhizobiaceae bacterium]|nr:DnaJ domain-containing protein [Rhizobiaceae bacterium]